MGKPYFELDSTNISVVCDVANALTITNSTIKRNTLIDIKNQIKK